MRRRQGTIRAGRFKTCGRGAIERDPVRAAKAMRVALPGGQRGEVVHFSRHGIKKLGSRKLQKPLSPGWVDHDCCDHCYELLSKQELPVARTCKISFAPKFKGEGARLQDGSTLSEAGATRAVASGGKGVIVGEDAGGEAAGEELMRGLAAHGDFLPGRVSAAEPGL